MAELPTKVCQTCGRIITWRKKWERNWDDIQYCGQQCKRNKPKDFDKALEAKILELLADRGRGKTICPSEAARVLKPEEWQPLMERTRQAARRLVAQGKLEITQKGQVVDPSTAKGPIRLRIANQ